MLKTHVNPKKSQEIKRVVVTGLGTVNPIGANVDQSWENLLNGVCGIGNISHIPELKGFKSQIGGELHKDYNPEEHVTSFSNARIFSLAHAAFKEAFKDSGYQIDTEEKSYKSGIIIGNQFGAMENIGLDDKTVLLKTMNHMVAGLLAIDYNFQGPTASASTASSSGLVAIGEAYRKIKYGYADFIIAGGADYNLNKHFFGGMEAFGANCNTFNNNPEKSSRPFDTKRAGPIMSDGAGLVALEEYSSAEARGAKIYGELVGYGHSTDAYHILRPLNNGFGTWRATNMALEEAGQTPEWIDHINSHATSTPVGDASEANAFSNIIWADRCNKEIMPEGIPSKYKSTLEKISIFGPKGHIGHGFCAAGGVETVFAMKTMQTGIVPFTLNLDELLPEGEGMNFVMHKPLKQKIKYLLKTSSAFGGHNNVLLFKNLAK